MNKIWTVAWREFIETVKTRAFFIGVILMPGLIVGAIYGANMMEEFARKEQTPLRRIAVVDEGAGVLPPLRAAVEKYNAENPQQPIEVEATDADEESLQREVRAEKWYAYIVVPAAAVTADGKPRVGRRDDQLVAGRMLASLVESAVVEARFEAAEPKVDRKQVQYLQRPVQLEMVNVASGKAAGEDEMARILTPFAFMFLLYMGTFGISMGLLTSVLEEKSSRVVEVLLAAISPTQLMAGKILGMSLVGVVVLGTWSAVGYLTARSQHMEHLITGVRLLWITLYFIPGFLLMSAILAGIGSACNTLKEAQSMVSPLSILNIVPMVLWFQLSQYPHSALSIALSYIPPITPFVMILRLCADPDLPLWQFITTLALMWVSVIAAIWAAGKIFRVGVLMYGKPPSIRELVRWIRYA
ncbi:MAG: ABC transporter permease [Phycisphaerales bacterium]|nr:ABC transporter permease [Phycisphaerales bacterium]